MNNNANLAVVVFNPEHARQQLMQLAQYVASPGFTDLIVWRSSNVTILSVRGDPGGPIIPVLAMMVGRVAREKAFLGTQGNFNPMWQDKLKNAMNAKQQLSLEEPTGFPGFARDFVTGLNKWEVIQGQIAKSTKRKYFIVDGKYIRLTHSLWEAKNADNDKPDRDAMTNGYRVNSEYTDWWDAVKKTHQICRMPVYDVNDNLVTRQDMLEDLLVGALVEVTFSLNHYYMGVNSQRAEAYDVFSGKIVSVSILVNAPPIIRTGLKVTSPTKPRYSSQGGPSTPSPLDTGALSNIVTPDPLPAPAVAPSPLDTGTLSNIVTPDPLPAPAVAPVPIITTANALPATLGANIAMQSAGKSPGGENIPRVIGGGDTSPGGSPDSSASPEGSSDSDLAGYTPSIAPSSPLTELSIGSPRNDPVADEDHANLARDAGPSTANDGETAQQAKDKAQARIDKGKGKADINQEVTKKGGTRKRGGEGNQGVAGKPEGGQITKRLRRAE